MDQNDASHIRATTRPGTQAGTRASSVIVVAVLIVGGCAAPPATPTQQGSVAATALPTRHATGTPSASTMGPGVANGRIAFVRADDAWEVSTAYTINPDGSNEVPIAGGRTRWSWISSWNTDGTKLLMSVGDRWSRPAVVGADGGGVKVLDAYPDRKLHLSPFGWSADGSRILVASGAPDPHPDRPDANVADLGLYSVDASDGGDLRRLSTSPDKANDSIFGVSPDGARIFVVRIPFGLQDAQDLPKTQDNEITLLAIKADGTTSPPLNPRNLAVITLDVWDPTSEALSPDGSTVAFCAAPLPNPGGIAYTLFVVNADGTDLRQLVSPDTGAVSVRWSPDGRRLAFTSKLRTGPQIWVINADGSGLKQLTDGRDGSTSLTPVWSPDGTTLLYQRKVGETEPASLWTVSIDGSRQRQLTATPIAGDFYGGYAWGASPH